ncbi:MAG: hypothetical protein LBF34_05080 [Puniceicoccales bacterium]|nr:hypothetical protein [Puniceicoccales bacterium]
MYKISKDGVVLLGSISLYHTFVSVKLQEDIIHIMPDGKWNHFLRQEKAQVPSRNGLMFAHGQSLNKYPLRNQSANRLTRPTIPVVPWQSINKYPLKNQSANRSTWPSSSVAQAQQGQKRSHSLNLVSPIGLFNKEGICFAIASAQILYAIPELHMEQSSIAYNGDRTSCEYRLFELLQAMKDSNKKEADKVLKEFLANSGCILGEGWDFLLFMENILAYLMRENPEVTQLFQMGISATSRPILDSFNPEKHSRIISSGIPKTRHEHVETTLLRLPKDISTQEGIQNWFHAIDNKYYIVANKYQVFYLKDKKIETLPPISLWRLSEFL